MSSMQLTGVPEVVVQTSLHGLSIACSCLSTILYMLCKRVDSAWSSLIIESSSFKFFFWTFSLMSKLCKELQAPTHRPACVDLFTTIWKPSYSSTTLMPHVSEAMSHGYKWGFWYSVFQINLNCSVFLLCASILKFYRINPKVKNLNYDLKESYI